MGGTRVRWDYVVGGPRSALAFVAAEGLTEKRCGAAGLSGLAREAIFLPAIFRWVS